MADQSIIIESKECNLAWTHFIPLFAFQLHRAHEALIRQNEIDSDQRIEQ